MSKVNFTNQNRLRRGEVEPKPTPVALSPENLKRSSTGESEGFSDYDNSGSYEDTDGDTDGERLVTNKQVQLKGPGCNDDVCILLLSVLKCIRHERQCFITIYKLQGQPRVCE